MATQRTIRFSKMQGAGNDFVVLDETRARYGLTREEYQFLGNRHYGVGADQILTVRPASSADVDFDYVIHNANGGEVEHCGNGARCFVRFVREQGLTDKTTIRVRTQNRILTLVERGDGQVTVEMGAPVFDALSIPYIPPSAGAELLWDYALSMGNPHAVCVTGIMKDGLNTAGLTEWVQKTGQSIQANPAFPQGVNVGFMQVIDRSHILLRVYERGAGETLACGTGACAAVVAGIQLGLLDGSVHVQALGGELRIDWEVATPSAPVKLTGPATTVFHGTIDL